MIISESVPVSAQGVGYPCTPGLFTDAQVAGWRRVTEAVHARKGLVFAQLQHCGRVSHPSMQPNNTVLVAPSALKPDGQAFTYAGPQDFVTPRALAVEELPSIIEQFRAAAIRAKWAGFDGVYVANNGYNVEQAQNAIQSGAADLVAFGLPFLANPDLVHRFKNTLPLNEPDQATFYGGGAQGYIDYPLHDAVSGA